MTLHELIFEKLNNHAEVTRDEILRYVNLNWHPLTDRALRNEVSEMIFKGYKIGTHHTRGYYIIRNDKDLEQAVAGLKAPVSKIIARAKKLYENCNAEFQTKLLFE